ncbi:hypothetical protein MMPV_007502 [Pyropia vietnamensis]
MQPPVATSTRRSATDEERRAAREVAKAEFFHAPLSSHTYRILHVIGEGAYGVVCAAVNESTSERVAIKRIKSVLDSYPVATRILRELKFLRLLRHHENVVTVADVLVPGERDRFNDAFVVSELMPTDLSKLLRSATPLSGDHVKYLMFQLLRAVHFLHSSNVFHRDIKPNNILVNKKCELRVCDFGLARAAFEEEPDPGFWTDYIATRWYRAPELIMAHLSNYSTAIDMWSVGCIFAEILSRGRPLFPGRDSNHQFRLIVEVTGTPTAAEIDQLRNPMAKRAVLALPQRPRRSLQSILPDADPAAVAVLERMLEFDPQKRISALGALHSEYFAAYAYMGLGAAAMPVPAADFEFERRRMSPEEMRREFLKEIVYYHPELSDELLGDMPSRAYGRGTAAMAGAFAGAIEMEDDGGGGEGGDAPGGSRRQPSHHTVGERDLEAINAAGGRRGGDFRSTTMDEQALKRLR